MTFDPNDRNYLYLMTSHHVSPFDMFVYVGISVTDCDGVCACHITYINKQSKTEINMCLAQTHI